MTEVLRLAVEFLLTGVTMFAMRIGEEEELHRRWTEAAERLTSSTLAPDR